jgi:hypothetical protein
MNWEQLDWPALDRLRAGFLSGSAAAGPYWTSLSDLASYDLTYAERIGWKWDALLRELTLRQWRPPAGTTLIDWGCGSGIAARRVAAALGADHFAALQVWDHSPLARSFAANQARARFPALAVTEIVSEPTPASVPASYTLVLSHVFNELSAEQRTALLALVAGAAAVLWIEPGTHADSRALATVRDQVRTTHQIVAPCTHRENCPLFLAANERDWCHFFALAPAGIQNDSNWVRFSHRAGLDLRSQAYSYLVLTAAPSSQRSNQSPLIRDQSSARRDQVSDSPAPSFPLPSSQLPTGSSAARVLGRVEIFKPYARFLACEATGLHWLELTKRTDPALIKRLDKAPPVPLYALTHDGNRVSAMTPLVEAAAPPAGED